MAAYTLPNQGQPRPTLPHQLYNPQLNDNETYTVKFQEIVRDGQSTVVARMKVPTPTGHAFILRRLDTGAVSLTTMFRAAFPTAPETMEKDESGWVKANYDLSGANRAGRARFAGTWVPSDLAQILAPAYKLDQILLPLLAAEPAPNTEFRRSARTVQEQQSSPARQMPTPASSQGTESPSGPSAPKRRRAESPAPATTTTPVKPPSSKKVGTNTGTPAGKPPSSAARTLRRSNRTASPAPTPIPHTVVASPRSPRSPRKKAEQAPTPAGSDATAVADDDHEAIVEGPEADMERDIAEQKELVAAFKQQREAAREWNAQIQEAAVEEKKREREEVDAPPSFNFAETTDIVPVSERALVSNKRVLGVPIQMTPQRRSVAWGALAAAAAAAAVAYYPW